MFVMMGVVYDIPSLLTYKLFFFLPSLRTPFFLFLAGFDLFYFPFQEEVDSFCIVLGMAGSGGGVLLEPLRQALGVLYANSGRLSDAEKQQVEGQLEEFKRRPDAWEQCLFFIKETQDPYVLFFAASVFEGTIATKWSQIPEASRVRVRGGLINFLMARHSAIPRFVLNKMVKVVVDIGKVDWPERYPDFFNHVMHTASDVRMYTFGLSLFKVMVEEFSTVGRNSVSVTGKRQKQLKQLLLQQIPTMITKINELFVQFRNVRISNNSDNGQMQDLFKCYEMLIETFQLLVNVPTSLEQRKLLFDGTMTTHLISLITECPLHPCSAHAISAVTTLVSNTYFPGELEGLVFKVTTEMLTSVGNIWQLRSAAKIHEQNEIFFPQMTEFWKALIRYHLRRFEGNATFPMEQFLGLMFEYTFSQPSAEALLEALEPWNMVLDHVVDNSSGSPGAAGGAGPGGFISLYMAGLDSFGKRLVDYILYAKSGATLMKLDSESYGDLEDWADQGDSPGKAFDGGEVRRNHGKSLLPHARCEVEVYIAHCADSIKKLMEVDSLAQSMMSSLLPTLSNAISVYRAAVFPNGQLASALVMSPQINALVDDLTSIVFCFSCGVDCLTTSFAQMLETSVQAFSALIQLGNELLQNRLYTIGHCLTKLSVSIVECLVSFGGWLQTFLEARNAGGLPQKLVPLAGTLCEQAGQLVLAGLNADISPPPEEILNCSVSFFRTMVFVVGPTKMDAPTLHRAFDNIWDVASKLPSTIKEKTAVMASDKMLLALDVAHCNDLGLQSAFNVYQQRMAPVFGRVEQICQQAIYNRNNNPSATPFCLDRGGLANFRECLRQIKAICVAIARRVTKEKLFVSKIFSPLIAQFGIVLNLCLLPVEHRSRHGASGGNSVHRSVSGISAAKDILAVFECSTVSLSAQFGVDVVHQMISGLVDIFMVNSQNAQNSPQGGSSLTGELMSALQKGSTMGSLLIQNLMNFLCVVMTERKKTFHRLHGKVYDLVLGTLAPVIMHGPSVNFVDLELAIYKFCRTALVHHWRTFVSANMDGGEFRNDAKKAVCMSMFEIVLKSFERGGQAPESFQYNLITLEEANKYNRLYDSPAFQSVLARHFYFNLLSVLCSGGQDLLSAEVMKTLHNMASANYKYFRVNILPALLNEMMAKAHSGANAGGVTPEEVSLLLESFCADNDRPDLFTFSTNVANFVSLKRRCDSS
jgi:hypothetical protein